MITRNSPGAAGYTADRRLCLDAQGNVVEGNDPARVELLAPAGGVIPLHKARALGLVPDEVLSETPDQNNAVEPGDQDPKPRTAIKKPLATT